MEPMVCDGMYSADNEEYLINLSSIFSYLIRECGKLVEDYNADIIYDINAISKYAVHGQADETKTFWIGLRESGVDHEDFMKYRCNNEYYYRGVYKIVVVKTDRRCTVTMHKSSSWEFNREHYTNG